MQKRRNYLINKKFQFSFLSKFVALLLLESVLIVTLFFYLSHGTVTTGYANSILTVETTRNFFLTPFILLTLIVAIGVAMAGMLVFILLSHRIAGPLYRFEVTLKKLQEGDMTTDVTLRKSDQLGEVQQELNVLIQSLDKRLGSLKSEVSELENLLSQHKDPASAHEIKAKIKLIRQIINHFKLSQKSPIA